MNFFKFLGFLIVGILICHDNIQVEARKRKKGGGIGKVFHKIAKVFRKVGRKTGITKVVHKIGRAVSTAGRKLLDMPPKHRSRFDKYPIYVMRHHQFIWKRYFKRYIQEVQDGRPSLPNPNCWSVSCWMKRNKFKSYWKWRSNIPIEGNNSPPFLHRRCRIPGTFGSRCRREHLRHDYYWRMFMWIGRYGFPSPPEHKTICITSYCQWQKNLWGRYWKNFWIYTSLIPIIRPFDFNWKFWLWRFGGNQMRLQQIAGPALMAMGQGGMMMMRGGNMMQGGMMNGMMQGGNMMHMMQAGAGGQHLTIDTKQAMIRLMQRNLAQTMQLASSSQSTLRRQQIDLMTLMRMPAFPSAISAQMQMQSMMQNMQYQQHMQQYRMQSMIQKQISGMGQYLRGSCGCGMCSHGGGGMYRSHHFPGGASMYVRHSGGMITGVGGMGMGMGYNGISGGTMAIPLHPVNNPIELKMRIKALYAKNNLPI